MSPNRPQVQLRVLIFTQYFTPEIGATQTRVHAFAAGLAERGHELTVVCELPNHPQGVVHPGYRGSPIRRRRLDGFEAVYVWVRARPEKTTANRLLFYVSYAAMASLVGAAMPRPDVVLASSPPLPVAVAGLLAAARFRVPWVMDVRDLWPEAAVALGELSNERALRLAERMERRLYASAAAITTVTEPFREAIATRTSDPAKVSVVPNGTTRLWVDGAELPGDRDAVDLPADRFIVAFAGNVGPAQGLEAAIDAAGLLDDGYQVLILGDGPARRKLEARAAALPPGRVVFRDQVPAPAAVLYLRACDCLLVPLAPHPSLRTFVPSKLYDFCAVGRPVVVAAAGEPQRLAAESGAALAIPPGDPDALASALRRLRGDAELRQRLVERGREFGAANLRERQLERIETVLGGAASGRSLHP